MGQHLYSMYLFNLQARKMGDMMETWEQRAKTRNKV